MALSLSKLLAGHLPNSSSKQKFYVLCLRELAKANALGRGRERRGSKQKGKNINETVLLPVYISV